MATARQSRASRSTAQASKDTGNLTVVPAAGGQSATGENTHPAKTTPAKADPKPAATTAKPAAGKKTVSTETYQKPFYRPTVNGKPVHCEHDPVGDDGKPTGRYGHDSEKAALACGRKIAAAA